jgi:hypothetical protein
MVVKVQVGLLNSNRVLNLHLAAPPSPTSFVVAVLLASSFSVWAILYVLPYVPYTPHRPGKWSCSHWLLTMFANVQHLMHFLSTHAYTLVVWYNFAKL